PRVRAVWWTRRAISPRLATRTEVIVVVGAVVSGVFMGGFLTSGRRRSGRSRRRLRSGSRTSSDRGSPGCPGDRSRRRRRASRQEGGQGLGLDLLGDRGLEPVDRVPVHLLPPGGRRRR